MNLPGSNRDADFCLLVCCSAAGACAAGDAHHAPAGVAAQQPCRRARRAPPDAAGWCWLLGLAPGVRAIGYLGWWWRTGSRCACLLLPHDHAPRVHMAWVVLCNIWQQRATSSLYQLLLTSRDGVLCSHPTPKLVPCTLSCHVALPSLFLRALPLVLLLAVLCVCHCLLMPPRCRCHRGALLLLQGIRPSVSLV